MVALAQMTPLLLLSTLLLCSATPDRDSDGDGLVDSLDTDDNDNGISDILDNDDDGDGIFDFNEDDDGDGLSNFGNYIPSLVSKRLNLNLSG